MLPSDTEYIRRNFRTLDQLCEDRTEKPDDVRRRISENSLPEPTYVLDDGTEMFPPDYFALLDAAGSVDQLPEHFEDRYRSAVAQLPDRGAIEPVKLEWESYISGEYGACLLEVTPENIVAKSRLMKTISSLLAEPAPEDEAWRRRLRTAVSHLDELEREFALYDRERFDGPVSRDRLIDFPRERYPEVFR